GWRTAADAAGGRGDAGRRAVLSAGIRPGPGHQSTLTAAQTRIAAVMDNPTVEDGVNVPLLVGLVSTFGSVVVLTFLFGILYFLFYTRQGRILLHRGRPGEYDDEQAFLREEEEGLESMDMLARTSYFQAKAFQEVNPPDSIPTDISLSQFMAIQEKGVSAWEFEPDFENANCFVEARTEIAFYEGECCVQTNLPVPKQNDVYYWEAKLYDKPDQTTVSIGMCTKPYPTFRLPGYHRFSVAYTSLGERRNNQPFGGHPYGPKLQQGDVVGVGFRPRTGTVFFTRNGKKLDEAAHAMRFNLFPTIGANGPCTVHVNFGQAGFVFIEANVKKWGLAPVTGSLAPPPPYGAEQGSILLEIGRVGARNAAAAAAIDGYAGGVAGHGTGSYRHVRSPFPPTDSDDRAVGDLINMANIRSPGPSRSAGSSSYAPTPNRPPSYSSDNEADPSSSENDHLLGRSPPPAFDQH
ncbi:concanavalin A-like lectin/glucanase domain-containing protein, partial [Dipodascopsis tothii]|uniref:concanavalin A-like lectin/glucanase domain-containing protein n=1 Tax=Dipodascopsis tothii TaxID=44089 RepID=UPI0034CE2A2B